MLFLLILSYGKPILAQSNHSNLSQASLFDELEKTGQDLANDYWQPRNINYGLGIMNFATLDPGFASQIVQLQNDLEASGISVMVTSAHRPYGGQVNNAVVTPAGYSTHNIGFSVDMNFTFNVVNTVALGSRFNHPSYQTSETYFRALESSGLNMPLLWDPIHIEPSPGSGTFARMTNVYSFISDVAQLNASDLEGKRLGSQEVARLAILVSRELLTDTPLIEDISGLYSQNDRYPSDVLARLAPAIWDRIKNSSLTQQADRRSNVQSLERIVLDIVHQRPMRADASSFGKPLGYWIEEWDKTAPIFGGSRQSPWRSQPDHAQDASRNLP
jgi:hypothetical protein